MDRSINQMMDIKVSIIVPCYMVEKYLDRCMESVVNQSLKEIEIILVDDGSKDNVPIICEKWRKEDDRIRVIHKNNEGLGLARNTGLELAKGIYVAFIDSDDYVDKQMYEILYEKAILCDADIVYSGVNKVNLNGEKIPYSLYDDNFKGEKIYQLLCDTIASPVGNPNPNMRTGSVWRGIFRRSILVDNQIIFRSERLILCEDSVFNLELYPKCKSIQFVPLPLYNYCFNESSISHTFNTKKIQALENLCKEIEESEVFVKYPDIQYRTMRMFVSLSLSFLNLIIDTDLALSQKRKYSSVLCCNKRFKQIQSSYPIKKMPFRWRMEFILLRYNLFFLALTLKRASNLKKNLTPFRGN
jgi:glycosyltransferase involved in cell wall biosynthesis